MHDELEKDEFLHDDQEEAEEELEEEEAAADMADIEEEMI